MKAPLPTEPAFAAPQCATAEEPVVRLLAGGANAFEHRLLASASSDRIPEASLRYLARALSVPPRVASHEIAPLESAPARAISFAKAGAVGGLCALVMLGTVLTRPRPEPLTANLPSMTTPSEASAAPMAKPLAVTAEVTPLDTATRASPELPAPAASLRAPAAHRRGSARDTSRTNESVPSNALRDELRLLETIQAALREGRAVDAADGLAMYARRFPRGELALEAELLDVDASLARGERARALEHAARLLRQPDGARYRARLDALLARGTDTPNPSPNPASNAEPRVGANAPRLHINGAEVSP